MRLNYVSNLRVCSMLMVVLYHSMCYYTPIWNYPNSINDSSIYGIALFLNAIDMPLFIFVSSFLYTNLLKAGKYSNTFDFIKNKCKRLLVPFLFWSIVVCIFLTDKSYITFIIYGASHLWFLGMLFLLFCVFRLFENLIRENTLKKDFYIFILLLGVSLFVCKIPSNPGFIIYQTISYSYIFFGGYISAKYNIFEKNNISNVRLKFLTCFLLVLMFVVCMFWKMKGFIYIYKSLQPFILYSIILFGRRFLDKELCIVKKMDFCGMGIYIIHHIVIQYVLTYEMVRLFMNSHYIAILIFFLGSLSISFVISYVLRQNSFIRLIIG